MLYRLGAFAEKHKDQGIKIGGLRWQIHNELENGLRDSGAIVRKGRSIWIDEDKYFEWVQSGNEPARAQV